MRLLVPAFVLALVLVMLAAPADADVGENALSAAAAGTVTRVDLEDDEVDWGVGGMLAGIYERGITLSVWLRAAVHVSFEHSIDGETRPGAAATLGASYRWDVLEWVPQVSVALGGHVASGTDIAAIADLALSIDHLTSRERSWGPWLGVRVLVDDDTQQTFWLGLRTTWRSGYF